MWASPEPFSEPLPARPAAGASAWSAIERVWLDIVAPPFRQRIAQLGWSPDSPEAYCHRCGTTVGPHEAGGGSDRGAPDGCRACRDTRPPWDRIVRLGEYDPPLSHFIQEVKFTRWRRLGREVGELLGETLRSELAAAGAECRAVVPVPIAFWRRMVRGIDHTSVIAAGAGRVLEAPVRQPLRRKYRPSQLEVTPSQRARNVAGSISAKRRPRPPARWWRSHPPENGRQPVIVVLDDVTTTGATLRATCRALRTLWRDLPPAERPRLWAAVIAKTPDPERRPADLHAPVGPSALSAYT